MERKLRARITLMFEYDLENIEGMTPEEVLEQDIKDLTQIEDYSFNNTKVSVVREEIFWK